MELCRVCLSIPGNLQQSLHLESNPQDIQQTYLELFNICTTLNAEFSDNLPKVLCLDCSSDLRNAYNFIERAKSSDYILRTEELHGKYEEGISIVKKFEMPETYDSPENGYDVDPERAGNSQYDYVEENEEDAVVTGGEGYYDDFMEDNKEDVLVQIHIERDNSNRTEDNVLDDHDHSPQSQNVLDCDPKYLHYESDEIDDSMLDEDRIEDFIQEDETTNICDDSQYTKERQRKPGNYQKTNSSDTLVKCNICGIKLLPASLTRHKNRKHYGNTNTFLCSFCPKIFVESSELQCHLRTHDKNRKPDICCNLCDKKLFTKTGLNNHIKVHSDIRPFPCTICDKTFRTKYNLDSHVFTHTREGGVPCPQCGKNFFHQRDVDLHMRFHTGDFPYECTICKKRFPIKSNLTYHIREHEGYRYECTICGKTFRKIQNLNKHKSVHLEPSNNPCPICNKNFTLPMKLKHHIKRNHKDVEKTNFDADNIDEEDFEIEYKYGDILEDI